MWRAADARWLVVGASGFVGRHLLAHLRACGITAAGTQAHGRLAGLLPFDLLTHRLPDCLGDYRPTHVVIAAVISDMDRCLTERDMSYRVNVVNTIRLIDDIRQIQAQPVFLSSNFVFDGRVGQYADDDAYAPANEYGRQKMEVEQHIRARVPGALVARLSANVGDSPREAHLFTQWHQRLRAGEPIVCIAGSRISPTYVEDVARALVLACTRELTGVYNIANPEYFYRDELARHFCRVLGLEPQVVCKPLQDFGFVDNRALLSDLDSARFARATGMRFTPMREVMERFRRMALEAD